MDERYNRNHLFYLICLQMTYIMPLNIFGQFPDSDAGVLTAVAPITYSVGVNNQCVFNSSPSAMMFNYSAFSTTAQTAVAMRQETLTQVENNGAENED